MFRLLLLFFLAYLVLRAVGRIIAAVRDDARRRDALPFEPFRHDGPGLRTPRPPQEEARPAARRPPDADIEDARWVDLP